MERQHIAQGFNAKNRKVVVYGAFDTDTLRSIVGCDQVTVQLRAEKNRSQKICPIRKNEMREDEFEIWLFNRPLKRSVVSSRLTNCRTVERHEKLDLDAQFEKDGLAGLIGRLAYSTEDERQGRPVRHRIPISGNLRTGSATLKSAVSLYKGFLENSGPPPPYPEPAREPPRPKPSKDAWPTWDTPSNELVLALAQSIVPFVRFLHPDIVREVVADNQKHRADWINALNDRDIDPAPYLWDKSPCAFPGVRRYAGGLEIAIVRKRASAGDTQVEKALKLDDNDYPKQLWSFVFRGAPFSKFGPDSYSLAHLADHKVHGNRYRDDFEVLDNAHTLHGLFTCPSNTVYIPRNLIKPTDFEGTLRSLLLRRAQVLYGEFCNIFPPFLRMSQDCSPEWNQSAFKWAEPVGSTKHIQAFLEFRKTRLNKLFEATRT